MTEAKPVWELAHRRGGNLAGRTGETRRLKACQGEAVCQNKHLAADRETLPDIVLTPTNADEASNVCEAIQLLMDNQQFFHPD